MSAISNIMSLQYQATRPAAHTEKKTDKEESEIVPMAHQYDKAIESFLQTDGYQNNQQGDCPSCSPTLSAEGSRNQSQSESTSTGTSAGVAVGNSLHAEKHSAQMETSNAATAQSTKTLTSAIASDITDNLKQVQGLIETAMSKPVSDENPETIGTSLKTLTERIQMSLGSARNGSTNDPQYIAEQDLGGGFVLDMIHGIISFNFSALLKERMSQKSTDEFIKTLKAGKQESIYPSFQDVLAEVGKVSSDLNLQGKDTLTKDQAKCVVQKIKKESANFSAAYHKIDQKKALSLLYQANPPA